MEPPVDVQCSEKETPGEQTAKHTSGQQKRKAQGSTRHSTRSSVKKSKH